jgi:hypothetical protein
MRWFRLIAALFCISLCGYYGTQAAAGNPWAVITTALWAAAAGIWLSNFIRSSVD